MKKLIALVLIVNLLRASMSLADTIDLSKLSYVELDALRAQCQLEMMKRDDWQEVTVPAGVYQVGVHIPAGKWRVICQTNNSTYIIWGEKLKENEHDIEFQGTKRYGYERVYNPNSKYHSPGQITEYTFTVREGEWIIINDNEAVFTPPVTTSLGFK